MTSRTELSRVTLVGERRRADLRPRVTPSLDRTDTDPQISGDRGTALAQGEPPGRPPGAITLRGTAAVRRSAPAPLWIPRDSGDTATTGQSSPLTHPRDRPQ